MSEELLTRITELEALYSSALAEAIQQYRWRQEDSECSRSEVEEGVDMLRTRIYNMSWPRMDDDYELTVEYLREARAEELPFCTQNGCLCQSCGRKYQHDLIVPDEAWEKIKPAGKSEGAGLLCPNCIMQRLASIGWSAGHLSAQSEGVK